MQRERERGRETDTRKNMCDDMCRDVLICVDMC